MNNSVNALVCIGFVTLACAGAPAEGRPTPPIPAAVTARGEPVYVGRVFPLRTAAASPTYVYERRVDDLGGRFVSTHVTRTPSGEVQLVESATHTADYELEEYTLHTNQLGQSGSIRVGPGDITFRLQDGHAERTNVEPKREGLVVGPTLVGYVVRHLDAIRHGTPVTLRMAVLDRLETIGFELSAVQAEPGQTRVQMTPTSFFVELLLDPVTFTFEASTGKLVRLEGRVPTKLREGGRLKDFDARVEYAFVAAGYR